MSTRNAIQIAFDRFGKDAGFEKKSGSWYYRGPEVISVSELQKSQYGPKYYFNQGFWLRVVKDKVFPKEVQAHVRARLGSLLPEDSKRIEDLLNLEYPLADDARIGEIVTLLKSRLLPLILRASTLAGLRQLEGQGIFKAAGLRKPALEMLTTIR